MAEEQKVVEGAGEVAQEGQEAAPETLTIDGKEYGLDDLKSRIALSDIAREAEEKYNRPIGKFWPEYTKTRQEADELRAKLAELENVKQQPAPKAEGEQLSPEDLRDQALKQLEELGGVSRRQFDQEVLRVLGAQRLIDEASNLLETAKTDGKPAVELPELLRYMDENGVKNPEVAYELMFREELKALEAQKVQTIKPKGLVTQEKSTAGSKLPETKPVGKDNLAEAIRSSLSRSQGVES